MIDRDRELLKQHQSYFDWVKALWKKLVVDPGHPDRRFRLAIDDEELRDVAPEGSIGFVAAVRNFCKAYRYNVYTAAQAADRIARSNKMAAPGSLGVLGACVLSAARMGNEGEFNALAYYPRFNNEILGVNSNAPTDGFDDLGEKWKRLKETIATEGFGRLMLPRDPWSSPFRGKRHINYPLSQCLFRRVDVDKLNEFLADQGDYGVSGEEAFDKLLGYVNYHRNVSVALQTSLQAASSITDLKEAYVAALDDLIADTTRLVKADRRRERQLVKPSEFGMARLRLVPEHASGTLAYDIILETLRDGEWEADENFRCEAADVLNGATVERFGLKYKYLGGEAAVFFASGDYDFATQRARKLPLRAALVVLAPMDCKTDLLELANEVKKQDTSVKDPIEELKLLERFRSLTAIRFTFTALGPNDKHLPPCLARYAIADASHLALKGGMEVEGGYLIGVPLRLELSFDPDIDDVPQISCDNKQLIPVEYEDRFEYDLSDFTTRQGQYFVTSSEPTLKLTFSVVDPPRTFTFPPTNGPINCVYFGPQFIRFYCDAGNVRRARKQALETDSDFVLMQGASVAHWQGQTDVG